MKLLRDESLQLGALPPSPRDLSHSCQNDGARRQIARPPLIPAAESALGLRPRSALSSAQVSPEWITATSPCNDLSANGDYPLNFVSHSTGSVHLLLQPLDPAANPQHRAACLLASVPLRESSIPRTNPTTPCIGQADRDCPCGSPLRWLRSR